jgi:hypothetical protein
LSFFGNGVFLTSSVFWARSFCLLASSGSLRFCGWPTVSFVSSRVLVWSLMMLSSFSIAFLTAASGSFFYFSAVAIA